MRVIRVSLASVDTPIAFARAVMELTGPKGQQPIAFARAVMELTGPKGQQPIAFARAVMELTGPKGQQHVSSVLACVHIVCQDRVVTRRHNMSHHVTPRHTTSRRIVGQDRVVDHIQLTGHVFITVMVLYSGL